MNANSSNAKYSLERGENGNKKVKANNTSKYQKDQQLKNCEHKMLDLLQTNSEGVIFSPPSPTLTEICDPTILSKNTQAVIKHICTKEQCVQRFQKFQKLGKSTTFPGSTKIPAAGSKAATAHPPQLIANRHSSKAYAAPEL